MRVITRITGCADGGTYERAHGRTWQQIIAWAPGVTLLQEALRPPAWVPLHLALRWLHGAELEPHLVKLRPATRTYWEQLGSTCVGGGQHVPPEARLRLVHADATGRGGTDPKGHPGQALSVVTAPRS